MTQRKRRGQGAGNRRGPGLSVDLGLLQVSLLSAGRKEVPHIPGARWFSGGSHTLSTCCFPSAQHNTAASLVFLLLPRVPLGPAATWPSRV